MVRFDFPTVAVAVGISLAIMVALLAALAAAWRHGRREARQQAEKQLRELREQLWHLLLIAAPRDVPHRDLRIVFEVDFLRVAPEDFARATGRPEAEVRSRYERARELIDRQVARPVG